MAAARSAGGAGWAQTPCKSLTSRSSAQTCSGGRSIQESMQYPARGEQMPNAYGGPAVPAMLPVMRLVPSLRMFAVGWPT